MYVLHVVCSPFGSSLCGFVLNLDRSDETTSRTGEQSDDGIVDTFVWVDTLR